ncbi:uncharacterized protein LOC143296474 [Babylonia areolata]|uniref:uncharacterized protein LOC143296474 n=1 Tax=Babylonia areolata TaxID=304850 RepID=UPI003FD3C9FD
MRRKSAAMKQVTCMGLLVLGLLLQLAATSANTTPAATTTTKPTNVSSTASAAGSTNSATTAMASNQPTVKTNVRQPATAEQTSVSETVTPAEKTDNTASAGDTTAVVVTTTPAAQPTTSSVAPPTSSVAPPTSSVAPPTSPASAPTSSVAPPTSPASAPTSSAAPPSSPASAPTSSAAAPTSPASAPTSSAAAPTSPASAPTSSAAAPTSPASAPTSSAAPPSTPVATPSTPVHTTSSPATTSSMVTPTITAPDVVISETNILLTETEQFVELHVLGSPDGNLTLAVFNGTSAEEKQYVELSASDLATSRFFCQPISSDAVQSLSSVVLALYSTKDYKHQVAASGLVDFAVFSISPIPAISESVQEVMLPDDEPVTVVKSGLDLSHNLSVSRCGQGPKKTSLFVLVAESQGHENRCNLTTQGSAPWTLQLHKKEENCKLSETENHLEVEKQLIERLNERCRCGVTTLLVNSNLTCARDLFLDFTVAESYEGQHGQVESAFTSFVSNGGDMTLGDKKFSVVNCTQKCRNKAPHGPPDSSSKASNGVTIAVVLSCIAVFLIILVSVILYMRGKRRGIIRQFRMTRLQEDDDMDDMDDFIGSGGEPSFSARGSK